MQFFASLTHIVLCVVFSSRFLFLQGNELGETLSRHASDLKLPQHNSSHIDLLPYSDLMAWLKKVDKPIYQKLAKVTVQPVYHCRFSCFCCSSFHAYLNVEEKDERCQFSFSAH